MISKLQQMYDDFISILENKELSHYQRELVLDAKNAVKILIAIGDSNE